ncbi:hypothetical protein LWI29_007682 [Acer saccharum]|uniref:Uncharacterized protein n=1 Tax=Acer saccharum TaxID=4024 RepID=A0AA39T1V6_ACESA|nr:hypothetical protein LWI29_007682 [Acer saccharum]
MSALIPENGRIFRSFLGFNAEISVSKDENLYPETQRLQRIAMVKCIEKNIVIDVLMFMSVLDILMIIL